MIKKFDRIIVVVLDGCGAGETPDSALFGDHHPSTIYHIWKEVGGFHTPYLKKLGFLKACGIDEEEIPIAEYGRLLPLSQGKDSVTGHWEMMGAITNTQFSTFPQGFPENMVEKIQNKGRTTFIGNKQASGIDIIEDFGLLHIKTGYPILYTSTDSVLQIAAHEDVIKVGDLYHLCKIARGVCDEGYNVQRIIARPFKTDEKDKFFRTNNRRDFSVAAPLNLIDRLPPVLGIGVVPELFNFRNFIKVKRTQSNAEHGKALLEALKTDHKFIFVNFEDFDMLYGHRNDPIGFAKCLEEFDLILKQVLEQLSSTDLLILTADHGNDPTHPGTNHTREYSPVVRYGISSGPLWDLEGLNQVSKWIEDYLNF